MAFYVGLDLGQSADYTALAVVEDITEMRSGGERGKSWHLRHLERYPLRTPYPQVADRVAALLRDPRLTRKEYDSTLGRTHKVRPQLFVDGTGVGVAVIDLLKERGLTFTSVTVTAGDTVNYDAGSYRVPKRDLVAVLEVALHTGTLKVAEGLKLWPVLREERLNFRRKVNLKTAHDSYEHWRETDHDDLVLATALACWGAKKGAWVPLISRA
jgi:hypothetical protein